MIVIVLGVQNQTTAIMSILGKWTGPNSIIVSAGRPHRPRDELLQGKL
jgi:hypothetical protein